MMWFYDIVNWMTGKTSISPVKNLLPKILPWCPGLTWSISEEVVQLNSSYVAVYDVYFHTAILVRNTCCP